MVGRTRSGAPLVPLSHEPIEGVGPALEDIASNHFTYASDPAGLRCPIGAHVRRANPRTGDLPAGTRSLFARLLRMLGFKSSSFLRRPRSPRPASIACCGAGASTARSSRRRTRSVQRRIRRSAGCISSAWSRTSRASSSSCRTPGSRARSSPASARRATRSWGAGRLFQTSQPPRPRCRRSRAWPRRAIHASPAAHRWPELPPQASFRCPGRACRRAASRACRSSSRSRAAPISSCRGSGRSAISRARPRPRRSPRPFRRLRASGAGKRRSCVLHRGLESAACISSAASSRSSAPPSTAPCASRSPA